MPRKKTNEEFVKELEKVNPNIELLEEYKYALEPILCRCKKDGYVWKSRPADLLKGKGCPKCAGNIKKTHDEFVEEMKSINPNIDILSKYENAKTRIKCKCKIDGHVWTATANNLLRGYGCPVCGGRMKMTHDEFVERLSIVNPDIEILGKYVNSKTPILCRCKIDGNEWEGIPSALLAGRKCMVCAGKIKKTHEQFLEELYLVNPNIIVLGEYINYDTPILCKCKIDGNEWCASPNNLLSYKGCPRCKKSQGERRIENYLIANNIKYETYAKFPNLVGVGNKPLSYDFYITNFNMLIEVQGRQHRMPIDIFGGEEAFQIQQEHDRRKREYAKSNGIELLEIWYDEFDKISEILESRLFRQSA